MTKQIEAKILGRDFSVGCPENEEESLLKSINYLNHKIEEIQKDGSVIGVDKTLIMAALNITHEYLNQSNNGEIHTIGYKDKLTQLNQILGEALD